MDLKTTDKFRVIAPARADLAGGTLDLWPLYCLIPNSLTLNIALDLFASVDFEVLESSTFKINLKNPRDSFQHTGFNFAIESIPESLKFPAFVIKNFFEAQGVTPALELRVQVNSSIPIGSGLGGSSTLLVALGRGLCRVATDFAEQGWQWRFLDWAKDTEAAFLKVPTGTQDYLAALFGGLHGYEHRLGKIEQSSFHPQVFQELNQRIVVVFSGEKHHSGLSNWEVYKKAVEGDSQVLTGLSEIAGVARNLEREFQKENIQWSEVGKCLDNEWVLRRKTFNVSTPTLEQVIRELRNFDILGLKVCGAAQGGSLLALVEPQKRPTVVEKIKKAGLQVVSTQATQSGVSIQDTSNDVD